MLNSKSNSSRPEGWLPAGYSVPLALTARQERYCRRAVDINRFVYNLCVATHRFCRSNKLRWPSRSSLESTRTLSGDTLMKAGFRQSGPRRDRAGTTLTPSCGNPEMPRSSATAGSAAPSSATTSPGRSPSWEKLTEKLTPAPKSFPTPVSGSTSGERDLSPYWSDFTEAISSELWLPTETGSDSSSSSGLPNRTAAGSWFSTTRITAPSRNSPRIFSPSCTPSVAGCTACAATATQSRRIRVYPTGDQRRLTYAHYRFQKFLTWKAWQVGKELVLVNEAYTSKTCSWSGGIIPNLGGRRAVAGSDGVRVDRDINGARGIFLRTLGDTPALRQAAQEYIGNCAVSVS